MIVTLRLGEHTNTVELPDGVKFNMGSISPHALLRRSTTKAVGQPALDRLLQVGEVKVDLDAEVFYHMFTPERSPRLATNGESSMSSLDLSFLNKAAAVTTKTLKDDDVKKLRREAVKDDNTDLVARCDMVLEGKIDIDDYVGLSKGFLREMPITKQEATEHVIEIINELEDMGKKKASAADPITLKAASILDKSDAVMDAIEAVVQTRKASEGGRTFNAAKAKAAVHAVTSKVAEAVEEEDEEKLDALDKEASHLVSLFPSIPKQAAQQQKTAGSSGYNTLMTLLGGESDVGDIYDAMANDDQTSDLFKEVCDKLAKELELSSGAEEALSRVRGLVQRGKSWDAALIRNNVFKAANSLGIRLPSGMF